MAYESDIKEIAKIRLKEEESYEIGDNLDKIGCVCAASGL